MADFDTKFLEMQKYLPFLKSVIEKLRNSSDQDDDNPRKAQLKKMEVLHDLLKSNGKKLKMETLLKCEGLLIKLASKMERIPLLQSEIETSKPTKPTSNISVTTTNTEVLRSKLDKVSSVEVVDITGPESPPPQQLEDLPPVEIPTERRSSRDDEKSPKSEQRDRHKHGSKNDRLHKHRHHFHHQRHEHHQSSHHSHEHHRQQSNQSNRSRDSSLDRSNDSSRIFNRRSVGTDKSSHSGNLNVNTTNHDKNHLEPQRNRDPRSSNEFAHEVYSSEDCWNDFSSNKSISANRNHAKRALPDSSSVSKSQEQRYHDTAFSFKKNVPKSNEMFSRVRNPEQSLTLSNRSAPISIPVKVPTIPEVLKSPPLSASDISDLLSEADEKPNENSVPSISEIGTRRPVKSLDNAITSAGIISPSAAATLDKVRKKFAIVTQSSPHLRDSPDVLKSPITITPKDTQNPLPKERIALKYNPHPRTERNSHQNISDTHLTQPTDPRLNPHRFSSASNKPVATSPSSSTLPQDPRLRKAATTIVGTSLYQQPQIMQHKAAPSQTHINSKVVPPLITPAIAKTPVRQSHIPSLMEVETIDPRIALSASFPSGSMDHRQQLTNNMPINIPQAGIFTRRDFPTNTVPLAYGGLPVPIEFGTRGNQHLDRPMVQQRSKSGYSSEENWDSDPDTAVVQKVIPQAPQIPQNRPFKEYPKGTDLHSGFRQAKAPLLPTPVFGRPNTGNTIQPLIVNPHLHQLSTAVPPNSNHSKFSAVLNDKTERSKYFESKKQKKIEPRTYMEYKQAKARAAAEEAARKAAEETAKAAAAATDKDIGEVSEVDSSVIAKLSEHPPTVSTLDKLYRSTNFSSCDFPKAKTSFKIPKKVTEKTADKSETETKLVEKKEEAKENKSQPDLSNQQQKDQPEQKIESLDKKKVIANNIGLQKDQEEQVKGKEGKIEKKKNSKENTMKTTVGVNKKCSEKVKRKPAVEPKDTGECTAQDNAHATVSSVNSNPEIESKNAQDVSTLSDTSTTELVIKKPQSNSASCEVPASTSDAKKKISSTQEAAEAKTSAEIVTEIQESNESEPQRLSNSAKADITPTKETAFLDELVNAGKPARILKRRNTMVVRGSLPEVDKEKIFPFKCLVYEDIQGANEEERRKQIDLMLPKKNKCLAEIFQKTDDNCKVSTQNIISGKRRTRTNVNFNVVQRSLEVFNHKRRSEPLKNSSEKASPIIKKPLPKGKKGAKGKAKQQLDEQATEEINDTKKLDEGTAKLQKPSISKQTAAGMEYAKQTPAEKIEKSTNPTRVDALMDEDTQKRYLLESFVQDILNPKKDKAQIFSLLSQILSEDNLKFVKEIVESQAEKNAAQIEANDEAVEDENISMSCEDLNKSNDSKETKESESNGGKPMKAKAKMKKRNELDRLNEDIRTMFISQGVLTATGRRMCTLVAAAEQVSTCDDNTTEKTEQTEVDAEVKHKAQILPRIRKSKVVLEQLNVEELQKQIKIKLKVNKVKVHDSSEESESELNSDAKTEKIPRRKMPILKPHTPIKQSEVEDDSADELTGEPAIKKINLNVEVKKVKPGPKSKKPKSALLSDDEEDGAEECEQTAEKATEATNKSTIIKNTNKEWHSQSKWAKWCVLCDTRISYPAAHYKRNHPEHYTSRLSPEVLEKLKMGKLSKPYFGIIQKKSLYWSYRCVFCFQHNRTIQSSWMDHFITHTGEYAFECSNCRRPFTKAHQLDNHIKTQCIGGTVVRKNPAPHGSVLSAHVCHLCNFIQLYRPNLDSHFINQHDIAKSKIAKLGHTIDLFDIRDVKVVDALKALEIESQILNEGLDRDEVVDAENQEEAIEIDEQSNSLREANVSPNPTESVNSDDMPIAKSLQCKESSHVKKAAVEEALNSNVFVPTRETNESPTMNNFAQSLFTITNEQREVAIGGAASIGSGSSISIAERLSQRFKNIKSGRNVTANTTATAASTEKTHTEASNAIDIIGLTSEAQNKTSETAALAPKGAENSTLSNKLNSSTEPAFTANGESVTVEFDQPPRDEATSAATETAVDSPIEDDDDNWEDIEITESAPSTASSVVSTASGTLNKSSKSRNKNVLHKLNRLYATNNKLKKSLSITMANRKKTTDEKRDIEAAQPASNENVANNVIIGVDKTNVSPAPAAVSALVPIPAPATDSAPALASAVQPQNEAVTLANLPQVNAEPNLGFRPLITNLDDLLPDSPCNDPIELVPELTPMESLQDLYDVSSILNSDYMSDNWEPDTTPIHLNNDSQQANMQEALDFVKEQQREQGNVAGTPIANTTGPLLALPSIQRIQNIGFSKSAEDTTFKFYCLSENCTFLYSSEAIGLESHFSCEHAQSSWNGYCHSCKAQVEGDNGKENKLALSAELNHMRSKHLTNPITPNLPVVETLKRPSKSNSPVLDEERPRIKIRRLTGDCLSTTPTPTSANSSKPISAFDENAQLVELTNVEQRSLPTISTSFLNKIQPTVEKPVENRHFQNIGAQMIRSNNNTQSKTAHAQTPPCQLQITSVVSLNESSVPSPSTTASQLPVISNVCSLNARSVASPINNISSLWAQHIADERSELEHAAAESMEVSRILSTPRTTSRLAVSDVDADKTVIASDSPEPQVVAETLPVAQATTGNYLITQSVSAQYEEGRLGFNISIANNPSTRLSRSDSCSSASNSSAVVSTAPQFKCMANGCKYQTRLAVAMGDHLQFHDRQNFSAQREYLRCSQCSYLAEDVDGFMQHAEEKHGMLARNASDTEAIRDILRNPDSQEFVQTFTQETWETALREIVSATGVPDSKLFRCTIKDCKTKLTDSSYYSHVVYHLSTLGQNNISAHTYRCPHCPITFQKPQKIKAHIKTHGIHRYFCYMCTATAVNMEQMLKHFEERHWRSKKLRSTPLPYKPTEKQCSFHAYFVAFTTLLRKHEIQQFREKLIDEWQRKKSNSRTHFKPSEIGLLPLTPIFDKILNCSVCPYKTKVRTNLMRHLQMHTDDSNGGTQHVANVDPVNPVPCLNSSEKHFDKMTNLASSSLVVGSTSGNTTNTATGGSNAAAVNVKGKCIYEYVPDTKRYTCGVDNCQYLTISDDIFRSHLNALHSDILYYNCPHCKEEICKRALSIERILSHLRFHGPKLYQCEFCGYLHYMRNVVDRHIRQHDVHPPSYVRVVEHDRTKESAVKKTDNTITSATPVSLSVAKSDTLKSKGGKYKWSCNLCGHKTMTQQQIVAHTTSQHSCKHQYQCMHCTFTATQLVQVMSHIDEKHAGKKREARYVFEKCEEADDSNSVNTIDTRPLWQRDDPTRVRHIRGILMEDEEESERYRKRLCLDDNDDGTENGDSDENLNLDQFGILCYYCNAQFPTLKDLREKHFQASKCKRFNAMKPFRFRICTEVKCPCCLSFVGNSLKLIDHMKEIHKVIKYIAADPNATSAGLTCGHCEYRGQSLGQLSQHITRMRHKPLDLKVMSLVQLEKLKALGSPLTYVQCLSCMELLANQSAFDAHIAQAHPNESDVISQILRDKLIYSCPICTYTSQSEMTVLRHMIDHYSGFQRCHFCGQPQTTFNGYMQHCYSDHREEIKDFCNIYTCTKISRYLQQLQLIFPNGLTVDLCNLRLTQCLKEYGNKHIKLLYDEIQKTSQQPPIPRLSLGRLVARKSIEAKMAETGGNSPMIAEAASASTAAALQLAGNNAKSLQPTIAAKRIMKRRSTVALGRDETAIEHFTMNCPPSVTTFSSKKRKMQHNLSLLPPPEVVTQSAVVDDFPSASDNEAAQPEQHELQPFSFYGEPPQQLDLNKIFIKIAAADTVETRINISKFQLLYNITPRVVVIPTDMTKYRKTAKVKRKETKPCPASHKIRYSLPAKLTK
ncbi:uncharacterized protein LOC128858904 isoform X1 [Anastrepha ludens]|uniref:uncharacterized protein LOC128858904 isoform X1 n=1 Tax=Anastrepha ludens TaxID=28586 RepID=UPI0023AE8C20|nr:uncharacterized protein LOC128858904 isoform X1 [Anastrepha ludens]XP_053951445.1 uncharacterized protein LOC128858904 isoform X1 [Anastrepha ludens]XP_053951446.1 uncharacterized protein LOC128858904 isoform X1 [Anastrepha ludens]XP_053951448.1 uncharacterized protein LOC128858904 isoform X1 [Anastrepha ludens]XP_053951449.1 uncharacterized protein LOC128858904 isoform X1 [Anastrepha ludens]XP_053951450.1 uncharacterized protein LOC128858904 isoform X1 [Anastrepha ludens]